MAKYCNDCGQKLADNRAAVGVDGRVKLFVDVAHPATPQFRRKMEDSVFDAMQKQQERYGIMP